MPLARKIDDTYWITEDDLVKDFLFRLENLLDCDLGESKSFVTDTLTYVKNHQRYSQKQDWALQKVEERYDTSLPHSSDFLFSDRNTATYPDGSLEDPDSPFFMGNDPL